MLRSVFRKLRRPPPAPVEEAAVTNDWTAGVLTAETKEIKRENAVVGLGEVFTLQDASRALAVKEKELAAQVKTSWAESVAKVKELVENGTVELGKVYLVNGKAVYVVKETVRDRDRGNQQVAKYEVKVMELG